jgi:hypothetical protein
MTTEISSHGIVLVEIMRKQLSGFEVLTVIGIDANGDEIRLKLFGDGPIPIRIESEKSK